MILNQASLAALNTGFRKLYDDGLASAEGKDDYLKIAMEVPSTSAEEAYGWLKALPRMREWLGDRVYQNIDGVDFIIKNRKFESTVTVKRDHIEDDKIGQYSNMFSLLGANAAMHPNELVFDLLSNAFSVECYDGQPFIDTDHPVINKNGVVESVSNHGGGSAAPWFLFDVKKVAKPFIFQRRRDYNFVSLTGLTDANVFDRDEYVYGVDSRVNAGPALWQLAYGSKQTLDLTNYGLGRANIAGRLTDYGKPMRLTGNLLVVGPSNEEKARQLLNAEQINGTTNTARGTAELLVVPELG